jgi:chemotaxis protein histidine kinase CheA
MSNVDLDKIQGVIETEITKATTAERKRIVTLVKDFAKDLVDAIQSGEGTEEEAPAPKKPAAKKAPAKKKAPAPKKEESVVEEAEEASDEPIDGAVYDIAEVEDDEVEESEYNGKKIAELRAICKERNITVPKGYKVDDIAKMLILDDEENEG